MSRKRQRVVMYEYDVTLSYMRSLLELVCRELYVSNLHACYKNPMQTAKDHFPHLAVGRLGVAFSESQPPRLVVDSNVCGVNDRCKLPERTTLPSAKNVLRCYPLRNNPHDLAGFSLDINSAQKRVVVKSQGLLGFQLGGSLYFYRVCPFGATFSA